MIISYAWTTEAFLCGDKRVTRRAWTDKTAFQYAPGTVHKAANKVLFAGGIIVGTVRAVSIRKEPLNRLLTEPEYGRAEWLAEGGPWYWETVEDFVRIFPCGGNASMWRFEFEIVDLNAAGERIRREALARRPAFYTQK